MSKSLGNFYTIEDVVKKGYDPLALRYLFLTAHYRKRINFTWDALSSAQNALGNLRKLVSNYKADNNESRTKLSEEKLAKIDKLREQFEGHITSDLKTPQALATIWEVVKSNIPNPDKLDLILNFDEVLGLGLNQTQPAKISPEVEKLAKKREELRKAGKFEEADKIRDKLKAEYNHEVRDKSS